MKGDWAFVVVLALVATVFPAMIGGDWVRAVFHVIDGWLMALPAPTDSWARLTGSIAWPAAILIIAWWLFEPLELAARKLAARFETDDVEFGKWVKVTSTKGVATYSATAVQLGTLCC